MAICMLIMKGKLTVPCVIVQVKTRDYGGKLCLTVAGKTLSGVAIAIIVVVVLLALILFCGLICCCCCCRR